MSSCGRILVVDDDPDLCWVLSRVLGDAGYEVSVAACGAEARRAVSLSSFELMLLDYRLPDTNGLQLLRELSKNAGPAPAVLMTSYPTPDLFELAVATGFGSVLNKPVSNRELLQAIACSLHKDPIPASDPASDPASESAAESAAMVRAGANDISQGLMLQGILHDLGNPLHSAISTLTYLEGKLEKEGSPHRQLTSVVLSALNRMDGLMRGFSMLLKGTPVQKVAIDLNAVVSEGLGVLQVECARREVTIDSNLEPGLPALLGSSEELARLFFNLTTNSLEAMGATGRLEITTRRLSMPDGHQVVLTVADTGPGLATQIEERLSVPFASTKGRGRGLGLFLCRQIARAYGGSFTLSNRAKGGAVARVEFPVKTKESG